MSSGQENIPATFDYQKAFSRNLGFIKPEEQERLRKARIAIAGLGGVGGIQAVALARMGVGRFTLADLDIFELTNFNRQMGASVDTIGRKKTEVTREMIHAINPTAEVRTLDQGIQPSTIDTFLEGADLVIDALDFGCFDERFLLYAKTREKGLWVFNVAPPGFGYSLFVFDPCGMSFEDYFDLKPDMTHEAKIFAMSYGISPSLLAFRYLDSRNINVKESRFPCVSPSFFLVAGVTATEVFNFFTRKRRIQSVPRIHQFDPLLRVYQKKYFPLGMKSPWHRMKKWLIRKLVSYKLSSQTR